MLNMREISSVETITHSTSIRRVRYSHGDLIIRDNLALATEIILLFPHISPDSMDSM